MVHDGDLQSWRSTFVFAARATETSRSWTWWVLSRESCSKMRYWY